jgi:alanyl-tRNA synthetase
MKTSQIREKFFTFFEKLDHTRVPSSSLIPAQDPTLLFANAGMNQFKDLFLAREKRTYTRAVSIQKCVRAGGKHNDLDNVGFTKRHLTFFEMMGNFSFGDYFKKEALRYAWDFLTIDMNIPKEKLVVTVFKEDDEAYTLWHKEIGVPQQQIFRCGEESNFWSMGDTGPCGPCSEILYDKGEAFGPSCTDPNECEERFLEIWNNVFMQYDRQPDGTLVPLKQKGVDTGMGLERLALVMQQKETVFETDIFETLIKKIESLCGHPYHQQPNDVKAAYNVLADHIRSSCLIIADGCTPSNEGRGYVLRKIIRRAALFDQKLSDQPIFPHLVETFVEAMSPIYPELYENKKLIQKLITIEVEKFTENLRRGTDILEEYIQDHVDTKQITGEEAFTLYDTHGFPYEVTELVAHEHGYTVDRKEFERFMALQRARSNKKEQAPLTISLDQHIKTVFTGYHEHATVSTIQAIIKDNAHVECVKAEEECWLIPTHSPFYIESGGQVSDEGLIIIGEEVIPVLDLQMIGDARALKVYAPINLCVGQEIAQKVDTHRIDTMRNHTATHLLQAALVKLFGTHIKQAGSLVTYNHLRFDVNLHEQITPGIIKAIEEFVNQKIWANIPVTIEQTTLKNAQERGVTAHFGEKYNPDAVRVVTIENVSNELCGGTHVSRTGDIGCFKITDVSAISAGTKRITAITGQHALALFQTTFRTVKAISNEFKVQPDEAYKTVEQHLELVKTLNKEMTSLKKQLITYQLPPLLERAQSIQGITFLHIHQPHASMNDLRDLTQACIEKQDGLYCATSTSETMLQYNIALSPSLTHKISLKQLAHYLKDTYSIRGGGNNAMIQGGGNTIIDMEKEIAQWLTSQL